MAKSVKYFSPRTRNVDQGVKMTSLMEHGEENSPCIETFLLLLPTPPEQLIHKGRGIELILNLPMACFDANKSGKVRIHGGCSVVEVTESGAGHRQHSRGPRADGCDRQAQAEMGRLSLELCPCCWTQDW